MRRCCIAAVGLLGLWACGGDSGSNVTAPTNESGPPGSPAPTGGAPTRIVFQHPGGGFPEYNVGPFEDSVPVGPGLRYVVRAVPTDEGGHAYTNLTLNWSVSGGGSLDHAVTSPSGGNDATLNGWTVGTSDGLESITVTLPAYTGVSGVLHVRVVHIQIVAFNPPNTTPLMLGAGQQTALTAQMLTAEGKPFVWGITFYADLSPYQPCGAHVTPTGGLAPTANAPLSESITVQTDAQGKATVFYTAPTSLPAGWGCQGMVGAVAATSPSGIAGLSTHYYDLTWLASVAPSPATKIVAVSGDGQAASPGATLGQPLLVEVTDAFGNAVPRVAVSWSISGGFLAPSSLTTDANGRVSAKWTVGATAGTQTATASIPGGASVTFTATVS